MAADIIGTVTISTTLGPLGCRLAGGAGREDASAIASASNSHLPSGSMHMPVRAVATFHDSAKPGATRTTTSACVSLGGGVDFAPAHAL